MSITTAEQTHDSQQARESDPAVVMDLSLGKTMPAGTVINVDYNALRETMRAVGATPTNDLVVAYEPVSESGDHAGHFVSDSEEYRPKEEKGPLVVVGLDEDQDFTQKVLQHELKHFADYSDGRLYGSTIKEFGYAVGDSVVNKKTIRKILKGATAGLVAGGATTSVGLRAGLVGTGLSPDAYDHAYSAAEISYAAGLLVGIGTVALGALYHLDGAERRARKAEKLEQPNVITVA